MERLTYGKPDDLIEWLSFQDKDTLLDIFPHAEKKSLNQNSFYWEIVGIIAKALREPNAYVHNYNLRLCEVYDGEECVAIKDTTEAELKTMYDQNKHYKPTSSTFENSSGVKFRWYRKLKGLRELSKEETSRLIDIALGQMQDMDLCLPREERYLKALEEHERNKHDSTLSV